MDEWRRLGRDLVQSLPATVLYVVGGVVLVLLWNAFIILYPSVAQIPREVVMPIVLTAMWLAVAIGAFRGGKRRLREPPGC